MMGENIPPGVTPYRPETYMVLLFTVMLVLSVKMSRTDLADRSIKQGDLILFVTGCLSFGVYATLTPGFGPKDPVTIWEAFAVTGVFAGAVVFATSMAPADGIYVTAFSLLVPFFVYPGISVALVAFGAGALLAIGYRWYRASSESGADAVGTPFVPFVSASCYVSVAICVFAGCYI